MADLKKLALGRKAFQKPAKSEAKAKAVKPVKTLEQSSAEEVGEVEAKFRAKIDKEDKRRQAATDSEFWFAVYFATREAKNRFLREHGLDRIGDKYLDGRAVDRALKGRSAGSIRDLHIRRK